MLQLDQIITDINTIGPFLKTQDYLFEEVSLITLFFPYCQFLYNLWLLQFIFFFFLAGHVHINIISLVITIQKRNKQQHFLVNQYQLGIYTF